MNARSFCSILMAGPVLRTYRSRIPPSQQSQTQTAPRELLSGPSLPSPFMRPVLGGSPIRHNKKGAAGNAAPPNLSCSQLLRRLERPVESPGVVSGSRVGVEEHIGGRGVGEYRRPTGQARSEEHTSELQSLRHL